MEKKIDRAVASAALAATLPAHTCVDRPHLPCDACDQGAHELACDVEEEYGPMFAAAPDMLGALERLTGVVRDMVNVYGNHSAEWLTAQPIFSEAERVIRKARGQQ